MKKFISLLFLLSICFGYSQEKATVNLKKQEIKVNVFTLLLGGLNVTYEKTLDDESGLGISVFASADENNFTTKFSLTPFYRFYFGTKPAAGFYIEGFGMFNTFKHTDIIFSSNASNYSETQSDLALGFGLGGKWITKKGLIFEINSGIGRNLFNSQSKDYGHLMVLRGGLSMGYRF